MNKRFTRFLSLLICMVMLIGILPINALGTSETNDAPEVVIDESAIEGTGEETIATDLQNNVSGFSLARSTGACYINHLPKMVTNNADFTISWTDNNGVAHSGKVYDLAWHYVDDQRNPGYCLEPDKSAGYGYGTLEDATIDTLGSGSAGAKVWDALSDTQREAIGLILLYGLPNNYWDWSRDLDGSYNNTNRGYFAAGQALVWEIVTGLRNPTWPYAYANVSNPKKIYNAFNYGSSVFANGYAAIVEDLSNHLVIPSFASRYKNSAPTISLKPDGTGWYTATVTDTNGVLSKFNFTDSTGNVSFTRNGNTLTIKAKALPSETTFAACKQVPSASKSSYFLAYSSSNKQSMIVINDGTPTDPVPAYFKLQIPVGSISGQKSTDTGTDLSGWEIQLKSGDTVIATTTSDSTGKFSFTNIPPGNYTLVETIPSDSKYECTTNNISVTVTAGNTTSVTVHNKLKAGNIQVTKTTNTGEDLGGWKIDLLDANKTFINTYTIPDCGTLTISDLAPGKYYLTEQGSDDVLWECDTEEKSVEVEPGETAVVTFSNIHYGRVQIKKSVVADGPLEGWKFKVTDSEGKEIPGSPFTSDKAGTITTDNLLPGTYTVEELLPEDSLYDCQSENPQAVTVVAGETASVSFVNILRPGRIEIKKTDSDGNLLAGAKFLLEWSEDGETWTPVTLSAKKHIVKGGCSSEHLENGCLITDSSGAIAFENLHPGLQYRITEVESPDGYVLLSDYAFVGKLPTNTLEATLSVVNSPGYILPSTGVDDPFQSIIFGSALTVLSIALGLYISMKQSNSNKTMKG